MTWKTISISREGIPSLGTQDLWEGERGGQAPPGLQKVWAWPQGLKLSWQTGQQRLSHQVLGQL